ncbi:hypothetical protein [Aureimonas endophytica]|uniref:hypothetical protein n=1 Tax=Aureimonas endophytica TaxID=2027858 RepID=UPI00166DF3F8|nr:hypothetical protein [Aureimonas endophytica]
MQHTAMSASVSQLPKADPQESTQLGCKSAGGIDRIGDGRFIDDTIGSWLSSKPDPWRLSAMDKFV